jgi:hypothetical protein
MVDKKKSDKGLAIPAIDGADKPITQSGKSCQ